MKISVVIIHFGDLSVTQKCIESLVTYEKDIFQMLIVNNTKESISAKNFDGRKNIIVFNERENVGFAKGTNIGIHYGLKSKTQAVLLLNNDTVITKPFISPLSDALEKKDIEIASPAIQFEKSGKTVFDVGGYYNKLYGRTHHKEVYSLPKEKYFYPDYVSGCCMLIRSDVFQNIGYFDEHYFLYYEDVDFCIRAKKYGYKIVVVTESSLHHLLSKSVGKVSYLSTYHQIRSAILFGKKYFSEFPKNVFNKLFIIVQTFLLLRANSRGGLGAVRALLTS